MATPATRSAAPASPPATTSADWTVQVADTIESVVGTVRDNTAVPLETVARALVYGIVLGTMGITALVLFTILLVRVLDYALPIWAAYLALGAIFTLLGMFLWRKRRAPARTDNSK
jgi:hypothetical protein